MRQALVSLAVTLFFACTVFAQRNAIPFVNQPLVPAGALPGSGAFTLTVNGTGFVSGATVDWNGSARTTTFISSSQLTAAILASDVASASTASVTVVNPAPGGGTSNVVYFPIAAPISPVALTSTVYMSEPSLNLSTSGLVASADVNNDGNVDIVENLFSNPYADGGIITFLGNGNGTFQTPILSDGDCEDGAIAIGDFNNDRKPDVAAIGLVNAEVCIMLGEGNGSFESGTATSIGVETAQGVSPVVADFNGDGNLDLAVAEGNGNGSIAVFLGNGNGTLQPAVQYASGFGYAETSALAIGDFNNDGKLDLIVGGEDLAILFGNGDGTFQPAVQLAYGFDDISTIVIADFNGDGNLDIVASDGQSLKLAVLLGNGDGTFQPEVDYPLLYGSYCAVVADLNNDGNLDLGCTGGQSNNQFTYSASIFLGNGNGTFQPQTNFLGQFYPPFSVAGGDFNNDGHLDLTIGQYGGETPGGYYSSIGVYLQTSVQLAPGSLTFPVTSYGTKSQPQYVTATNEGQTTLDISSIKVAGTYPADFEQTNNCGTSLGANQKCTIAVYFTPTDVLDDGAAVAITDNAVGSPQSISLQGTATPYLLTPSTTNFGNVAVGQMSEKTVTLKNAGTYTIEVGSVTIYGSGAGDFFETNNCKSLLSAGGSCQIFVTFAPSSKGEHSATLEVGDSPVNAVVEGNGT
jgi:hypothetical protein